MRTRTQNRKVILPGLLLVLAAALVGGAASALSREGFETVYLYDLADESHGWTYEVRTVSGTPEAVSPQFVDEYDFVLPASEDYDALKMSRTMAEDLEWPYLEISCAPVGIEVFLDGILLYSDFQTAERDACGYLSADAREGRTAGGFTEDWKSVAVYLPEDYRGKELEVYQYYPETAEVKWTPGVMLTNDNAENAVVMIASLPGTLRIFLMGCVVMGVAAVGAVSLFCRRFDPKLPFLFLTNVLLFGESVYMSDMGFYSGLRGWADESLAALLPVSMDTPTLLGLALNLSAAVLLAVTVWDRRRTGRQILWGWLLFGSLGAFLLAAAQGSTETGGGLSGIWAAIRCMQDYNFRPIMALCADTIAYALTFYMAVEFTLWYLSEWKKQARLLERSRFAVKNHDLIMQVDEDSRRRRHEMKHHLETLYALIAAEEAEQAKGYVEKVLKDTELFAEGTYSTNIVLNSIVGVRLNQAKRNGIAVQCHIHAPDRLSVDEVDLSVLLSNMLENSLEACMRMADRREAHIRLTIRKRGQFLYIECANSMNPGELPAGDRKTLKADAANHGFGLEAMETVAEKYASIIQMECGEGEFTVRTNLCLTE